MPLSFLHSLGIIINRWQLTSNSIFVLATGLFYVLQTCLHVQDFRPGFLQKTSFLNRTNNSLSWFTKPSSKFYAGKNCSQTYLWINWEVGISRTQKHKQRNMWKREREKERIFIDWILIRKSREISSKGFP